MEPANGRTTTAPKSRHGDWTCACGQSYRVSAVAGEIRMWPRNSNAGYALLSIGDTCFCGAPIPRGTLMSGLFGAMVQGTESPPTNPPLSFGR